MNIDFDKMIKFATTVQEKAIQAVIAMNEVLPVLIVSLNQFVEYMEAAKQATEENHTAITREEKITFVHEQIGGEREKIESMDDDVLNRAFRTLSQTETPENSEENTSS